MGSAKALVLYRASYDLVDDKTGNTVLEPNTDQAHVAAVDLETAVELAKKLAPHVRSASAVHKRLRLRDITIAVEEIWVLE